MSDAIRFFAEVTPELSEEFLGLCYVMDMLGCEESETNGNVVFTCYFGTTEASEKASGAVSDLAVRIWGQEEIIDRDWNAKWRETIEPVQITDTIWVSPEWLEPPMNSDDHWIKIEPRMAFGTGHHETTRLCAQQIVAERGERTSLLDIGTGSGILAFVADYAGYTRITGVEIDPDCKINLEENLEANPGSAHIDFLIGTVNELESELKYDTVVMNMISSISAPLLGEARSRLNAGGMLIWSGLLVTEKEECLKKAEDAGFSMIADNAEGEWWSARFEIAHA